MIVRSDSMKSADTTAAETIPIRLLISVTVIAAISVLVGTGMGALRTSLAQHQVEQQCHDLVSTLNTMVHSGAPRDLEDWLASAGTMRIQTLSLPDDLVYLSFGGDPDTENTGMLHSHLTDDGSVIFYRVNGGSKQVIWFSQGTYRFREGRLINTTWTLEGDGESFILDHGGTSTLVFELVEKNHETYILIHGTDGIE
jgi:hypothetical protein